MSYQNYHEVQRMIVDRAHLESAITSAQHEAEINMGQRMKLLGFREEERIDPGSGRKTILVYAQFAPVTADTAMPKQGLDPTNLNDSQEAQLPVTKDWVNKDEQF